MNEKIAACFANPIQCKLLIEILDKGRATPKQLAETLGDIAHATLYRHLKKMTADGILQIVEENKIRGTVEKVYAVVDDLLEDIKRMVVENNGQAYMMLFNQFIVGLTEEFRAYTAQPEIDLLGDGSGFNTSPIYATRSELESAITEINSILLRLMQNSKNPDRKLHSIAVIITPPRA